MDEWRVERLDRGHVREGFDCGMPPLNDFLQVLVSQYESQFGTDLCRRSRR